MTRHKFYKKNQISTLKSCEILSKSSTKCFDISSVLGTRQGQPTNELLFQFRLLIILKAKLK